MQDEREVRIAIILARVTPVNRCRRVDVVDDQIEVAAVVQIDVDSAVRESLLIQAPRWADTAEREIAVVVERVVLQRNLRHFLQQLEIRLGDTVLEGRLHRLLTDVSDVVEVVWPTIDAVADEEVLAAIIVEVGEEWRPAPVGGGDAGEVADLAEFPVASIQ